MFASTILLELHFTLLRGNHKSIKLGRILYKFEFRPCKIIRIYIIIIAYYYSS